MLRSRFMNRQSRLSAWIILCGLLYIFAYQFKLPFKADVFLYSMVIGLVVMTLLDGQIEPTKQVVFFALVAVSSLIGVAYTTMPDEGIREAILFAFFAVLFLLSSANLAFVVSFIKWIYIISIVVVLSSILHFILPDWFNNLMSNLLREDAYEQLMWSFNVDSTFAGLSAYTPNTSFSAAIVFGNSFLNIINKNELVIIRSKFWNAVLLFLSLLSIILCSKRGVFVATGSALVIMMFYLYKGKNFLVRSLGVAALFTVLLIILYNTNEFVFAFINRFVSGDFMTGRSEIYESLLNDWREGNIFLGHGTASAFMLAEKGAHNIYIQILYDHGIVLSIPYYVLLLYNYYISFKNKSPISIFVQTMFLVYGLSGNPLYSNMFMMIYIYYVLYATKMPELEEIRREFRDAGAYERDSFY